jgi:hypothetical protein
MDTLGGVGRQRLPRAIKGTKNYVPVNDGAGGLGDPVEGNIQLNTTTGAFATKPSVDGVHSLGSPSLQFNGVYDKGGFFSNGVRVGYNLRADGAGDWHTLTTSSVLLNFSSTDPSLTLDQAGTYVIMARVQLRYASWVYAAGSRTAELKLRETSIGNDLTNGTVSSPTRVSVVANLTELFWDVSWSVIYTTTVATHIIQLWGKIDGAPDSGSLNAYVASIVAVRLY